jgi:hypothetical protein
MIMNPGVRKLALTAHVATSVGWLGAVAAFLVPSIAGLNSTNAATVRGAYNGIRGAVIIVHLHRGGMGSARALAGALHG